jgi:UDP-N-acetylmuramoyl-L-alanyl-D-glutamate--2,6-diaminopimelate ligase
MNVEQLKRIIDPHIHGGPLQGDVTGIAYDSRKVRPGHVFFALRGTRRDGVHFIEDAVNRGAIAIVGEQPWSRRDLSYLQVKDARKALALAAAAFYDHPSRSLTTVGITGTNGKTTAAWLARALLRGAGRKPGLVGTIRYEVGERILPAHRTTPEAPDLQALLREMVSAGCDTAIMEVSSHGLAQKRVMGVEFDIGVFTNLTREHLDYHGTMQAYFDAKSLLFDSLAESSKQTSAVINLDDAWGKRLEGACKNSTAIISFGASPDAEVRAGDIQTDLRGCRFRVVSPWGTADLRVPLPGAFNVSNALAAVAVAGLLGIGLDTVRESLEQAEPIPGRMEAVPNDRNIHVFVDYAHTDDALRNALSMLRGLTAGRLIVVFGCGGDRDRSKRALMGAAAEKWADHTVLTSDNPRTEDPESIICDILAGFKRPGEVEREGDRRLAIERALALARPGDTVLVAGKGHETCQEVGSTIIPFDDRDVVREILT